MSLIYTDKRLLALESADAATRLTALESNRLLTANLKAAFVALGQPWVDSYETVSVTATSGGTYRPATSWTYEKKTMPNGKKLWSGSATMQVSNVAFSTNSFASVWGGGSIVFPPPTGCIASSIIASITVIGITCGFCGYTGFLDTNYEVYPFMVSGSAVTGKTVAVNVQASGTWS